MTSGLRPAAPATQRLATAAALLALLLLLFKDTALTMASTWFRSETYTHAILVPPIVGWMIWRERAALAAQPTQAMPWLLVPMALVCLLWLLGDLGQVNALTQLALVTLIVLSVPALFGWAVTKTILFPLGFLYFAVPLGDFLLPTMMDWTAHFTVAALRLSGVPVYREANQFVIPSGSWSVVEACSGVRYLIASLMVGTLFAYLNYRSAKRRIVFMAIAIVVPIVANWLRAYIIVMLGHLSNNEIATGVDHIVYGWLFFGIVIMVMFGIGSMWSEPAAAPAASAATPAAPAMANAGTPWMVLIGILALTTATQSLAWRFDRAQGAEPLLALPDVPGWHAAPLTLDNWKPAFRDPNVIATGEYSAAADRVGVWVGYYRNPTYQRKLVTPENKIIDSEDKVWAIVGSGQSSAAGVALRSVDLRTGGALSTAGAQRLHVWQTYWIDGRYMASDARARVQQVVNRLLGRGDDGAAVLMFVAGKTPDEADAVLQRFAPAYLEVLDQRLATVQAGR